MGGCRCVYRSCQNSTSVSPGLHYFHFPIRDPARCELWIKNALKPAFRTLDKDKLRNKVVCSIHFERKCFTNERRDRLIHSAVPTLGFEDDEESTGDPLHTSSSNNYQSMGDDNIMLIPMDEENTKFAIPHVEFSGMSYTIFDDAVIPTSKIEEVIIKELHSTPAPKQKELQIKTIVKKIKNIPPSKKVVKVPIPQQQNNQQQFSNFNQTVEHTQQLPTSSTSEQSNNISSYSVSTLNGDVSLTPTTHILPDILSETIEEQLTDFPNNSVVVTSTNVEQNSSQSSNNISVQLKTENESPTSVNLDQKICLTINENSQESTVEEITPENNQQQSTEKEVEECQNDNMQKEYVEMIQNNTNQIKQLKRLVQKQNKMYRAIWQKKQMPHMKVRRLSKSDIIESLKAYVKPSLLAILKLELLPEDEVVLNDSEEKFITDLYTENRECYDLLRNKFKWNLPFSDKNDDTFTMQCD